MLYNDLIGSLAAPDQKHAHPNDGALSPSRLDRDVVRGVTRWKALIRLIASSCPGVNPTSDTRCMWDYVRV
ncbi:hypothetical protein EI94DRAFT_1717960 [Lactarius quietus]|nr:hypothetical protein EI94DRAFT_1717960 [Lactarius quietus]